MSRFPDLESATSMRSQRARKTTSAGPIDWLVWTPAAGLEWRGWTTPWALTTPRAHGRLDAGRP